MSHSALFVFLKFTAQYVFQLFFIDAHSLLFFEDSDSASVDQLSSFATFLVSALSLFPQLETLQLSFMKSYFLYRDHSAALQLIFAALRECYHLCNLILDMILSQDNYELLAAELPHFGSRLRALAFFDHDSEMKDPSTLHTLHLNSQNQILLPALSRCPLLLLLYSVSTCGHPMITN